MAMKIKVVNMTSRSLSNERRQDSEPNITVNPSNPRQIAGTAFTPDPAGSKKAPIYLSNDGGDTWTLNPIVPGGNVFTGSWDITMRFSAKTFYAQAILRPTPGPLQMDVLRTTDPAAPFPMALLEHRGPPLVDQPYGEAFTVPVGPDEGKDRLYVGCNDFAYFGGGTAVVDRSLDAGGPAVFATLKIESRPTAGQDGPSVRTATHRDGTVYAGFFGWRNWAAFPKITSDIVVVRDDAWAAGVNPFTALTDPGDGKSGVRVVSGVTITWDDDIGQQRTGSNITIAVDPNNSSTVYLAWCDTQPVGYTLHIRKSTDRGITWSNDDLLTVMLATNPSLAISKDGKVGLLYQQVTGVGPAQRWENHFRRTVDGAVWEDYLLCTTPANQPVASFDPYLGDYNHLTAVGSDFYGIFSANNTPDFANFPFGVTYQRNADFVGHRLLGVDGITQIPISIDPFFFKVSDEPVPGGGTGDSTICTSCAVPLKEIPTECLSPAAPAWLPYSYCFFWYETRYVRVGRLIYKIVYQHCAKFLGRQQGSLLYTLTLLPGETQRISHFERHRRTHASTDTYSIHASWRQYVSALQQSKAVHSTSDYQKFLENVKADGDGNSTVGGALFPFSWSVEGVDDRTIELVRTAQVDTVSEDFRQTLSVTSQQLELDRSIVVSNFEEAETRDAVTRLLKNDNHCRAVNYFVRRVNEAYELTTVVMYIEYAPLLDQKTLRGIEWRKIDDHVGVNEEILRDVKRSLALLPKPGGQAQASEPISLPTDGVIYEAELAHCSSCEPEHLAEVEIAIEKAKAEARKQCLEAELLELEVQRRRLLLESGKLDNF